MIFFLYQHATQILYLSNYFPDSIDTFGCQDFTSTTTTVTFAAGSVAGAQMCINIPITDDNCCEVLENFQVDASSTNAGVTFRTSSSATVFIQDNDGK